MDVSALHKYSDPGLSSEYVQMHLFAQSKYSVFRRMEHKAAVYSISYERQSKTKTDMV